MPSFPTMRDLPPFLFADGWNWRQFSTPSFPSRDVWLGTDSEGRAWLTKLSGSYNTYREIVFCRIAQELGWSCQSSVFLKLSAADARTIGAQVGEIHCAHWFFSEHVHPSQCGSNCPLAPIVHPGIGRTVEELETLRVDHAIDLAKGHFASCIFGANEAPEALWTSDHTMVLIDNESMLQSPPCPLDGTPYWGTECGERLAREVCREIGSLPDTSLRAALDIPEGLRIRRSNEVPPRLKAGHAFAKHFARDPSSTRPPAARGRSTAR
jgi:hypothetical protein